MIDLVTPEDDVRRAVAPRLVDNRSHTCADRLKTGPTPAPLMAVDPGSRVVGFAVFRNGELADAGMIRAFKPSAPPLERILSLCADLLNLCDKHEPATVVIEMPSGHVSRGRRAIGGHGLTTLGIAAGAIWAALVSHLRPGVIQTVDPHVWTRGMGKRQRQRLVAASEPRYQADEDGGGDAADAIGIGRYWIAQAKAAAIEAAGPPARRARGGHS